MTYENYFRSKAFKQVLDDFKQCEANGVPCIISSDDYSDLILYYHQNNHDEKAAEIFEKAMTLYPNALSLMTVKIRMILTKGQVEEAWKLVEQIEDQEDPEYSHIIAEIMIAEGKFEEADQYLEEWFQERCDEEGMEDFAMDTAWLFQDLNLVALARKWLDKVDDQEDEEYLELKAILLSLEGNYEESKRIINLLIDRDPYAVSYWNLLAHTQLKNGELKESITSSEYSLAINPEDPEGLYYKASALYALDNVEEAVQYFERYSRLCPQDPNGEFFQGTCLTDLNRFEEAMVHLKKAEQLMESDVPFSFDPSSLYRELSFVCSQSDHPEEALNYLAKMDADEYDRNELLVMKGHIFLQCERYLEAQDCFTKAMEGSQCAPHIVFQMASSMYYFKHYDECYEALQTILPFPNEYWQGKGYALLAACAFQRKDKSAFEKYMKEGLKHDPTTTKAIVVQLFPEDLTAHEAVEFAKNHFLSSHQTEE